MPKSPPSLRCPCRKIGSTRLIFLFSFLSLFFFSNLKEKLHRLILLLPAMVLHIHVKNKHQICKKKKKKGIFLSCTSFLISHASMLAETHNTHCHIGINVERLQIRCTSTFLRGLKVHTGHLGPWGDCRLCFQKWEQMQCQYQDSFAPYTWRKYLINQSK